MKLRSFSKLITLLVIISFIYASSSFATIYAEEVSINEETPASTPADTDSTATEEDTQSDPSESDPVDTDDGTVNEEDEPEMAEDESSSDEDGVDSETEDSETSSPPEEDGTEDTEGTSSTDGSPEGISASIEEGTDATTTPSSGDPQDGATSTSEVSGGTTSTSTATGTVPTMTASDSGSVSSSATTSTTTLSYENAATSTSETEETSTSTQATTTATSTASSTVVTGTSVALANILNMVNTNFINSEGVVLFKNFFETLTGDFDIRDFYNPLATWGCSLTSCSSDEVHTNIQNDALIDNELYVEAVSGGNTVENTGDATIRTGDAYAGVNLVNIANTNVVDSNYLLLTMNAFQDVEGDIVFPNLQTFFKNLALSGSPASFNVNNSASVTNNVSLNAESGNNHTENTASSTIKTGESASSANVFNQLNTSLAGEKSISIIFRVHGSWAGEIFGAPDDLMWMDNGMGGVYLFDSGGAKNEGSNVHVSATNTASIRNNVEVVALTGENAISGAETALISTGDAYAGANIMNIANATVVGRNWMLAIVNILGDFNGNIAFGRPDLWVGGQVNVPGRIENGSNLTYTLTVMNNGDSPATDVTLANSFDAERLEVTSASVPFTNNGEGDIRWELPDLNPGEATEIVFGGTVRNADYNVDIDSTVHVQARETDNDTGDNTDIITVTTSSRQSSGGSIRIRPASDTDLVSALTEEEMEEALTIERVTAATDVHLGSTYTTTEHVLIRNETGVVLTGVTFHDFLKDPSGKILHEDIWDLGDVQPFEEIAISYDIGFSTDAPTGLYTLDTLLEWEEEHSEMYERNGTILVWGNQPLSEPEMLDTLPPASETLEAVDHPVIPPEDTSSFLDLLRTKTVEAAESTDSTLPTDERLSKQFGVAGSLTLLASLMILYNWQLPRQWYRILRRRIDSFL